MTFVAEAKAVLFTTAVLRNRYCTMRTFPAILWSEHEQAKYGLEEYRKERVTRISSYTVFSRLELMISAERSPTTRSRAVTFATTFLGKRLSVIGLETAQIAKLLSFWP